MPNATLPRSTAPAADTLHLTDPLARRLIDPAARVVCAAAALTDAVADFDAALDEGRPMHALVQLDQRVTAADRLYCAAVAAVPSA